MPRETQKLPLAGAAPGAQRHLLVHRYGAPEARPKAYLHAALHADEIPGLLTLHHLQRLLDAAEAEGRIAGRVVVVPYANPIGLDQNLNATHLGRYEQAGGGNFNRNWPELSALLPDDLGERLGGDAAANVATIRAALREAVESLPARRELESLRQALAREAVDADIVLDLHCDDEALMHLFVIPQHWPEAADLAAELGCRAVLICEDSGGGSFDEAFSTLWVRLARRFPDKAIPPACLAATVELRGLADVSDEFALRDAEALFRFLQRRGLIAGDPGPPPAALCEATRLDACDSIRAPATGVLAYRVALGERVRKGEVIAELVDPSATDPAQARRPIVSEADGLVLSRRAHKYVAAGMSLAKIVGKEPLPGREGGYLLED